MGEVLSIRDYCWGECDRAVHEERMYTNQQEDSGSSWQRIVDVLGGRKHIATREFDVCVIVMDCLRVEVPVWLNGLSFVVNDDSLCFV